MQGILNQMIQKYARPRGRPRSFDEGAALDKAIQVFWSKGYDGVTVDDLVAGMGVGRPSLYSVFGDKRTLFLRALKAYAERKGALTAEHTPLAAHPARVDRKLYEVHRHKCDGERKCFGVSSHVRRAARGRC